MSRSEPTVTIDIIPKSYDEEILCLPEEYSITHLKHSIELILRRSDCAWRARVTLQAKWSKTTSKLRRKKIISSLCRHIKFERLQLLRDTVTQLVISSEHDAATTGTLPIEPNLDVNNAEIRLQGRCFYMQEDPYRIRFPIYKYDSTTPMRDLSEIITEKELAAGVHTVRLPPAEQAYVYKEIARPLYEPRDTEILEQELQNLKLLRGANYVVQLVGVVVSSNPYRTARMNESDDRLVLRGLLLEYHSKGTLDDALRFPDQDANRSWQRWALQIALGLHELHCHDLTHMDLKPANIVITADNNAVIIDISGRAVSQEWLSPEMRDVFSPCSQTIQARIRNDVWAFGKLLSRMGSASCDDAEKGLLTSLSSWIGICRHIPLRDVISALQPSHQYSSQSTSSLWKPPFDLPPAEQSAACPIILNG